MDVGSFVLGGTVPHDDAHVHANLHRLVRRGDFSHTVEELADPAHVHPPGHAFTIRASGKNFVVHARRNDALFTPGFKETLQLSDGSVQEIPRLLAANGPKRHCHYIGTVEGDEAGSFVFSTCNGGVRGRLQVRCTAG